MKTLKTSHAPLDRPVERRKLLIVEDEPNSRRALDTLLTRIGFDCRVAADGQAALESMKTFAPDAIVMDMMMPILDGLETTRRIKADAGTRDIPVLALSANSTPEGIADALCAGCDEFLDKPVSLQDLLECINRYLNALAPKRIERG